MRVTAGKLKGRKLQALADNRIRPTSDRGRQALFNMLCHDGPLHADAPGIALVGGRFLDVCAGTGANGIEALSRGARSAVFMDRDLRCAKRNLAGVDLERLRATVEWIEGDACTPPPTCQPAEVLFLDPPYGQGLVAPILSALQKAGWVAEHGLVIAETARDELWAPPSGWRLVDERRYGKTRLTFLRWSKR